MHVDEDNKSALNVMKGDTMITCPDKKRIFRLFKITGADKPTWHSVVSVRPFCSILSTPAATSCLRISEVMETHPPDTLMSVACRHTGLPPLQLRGEASEQGGARCVHAIGQQSLRVEVA